jgi:hypothetical protein
MTFEPLFTVVDATILDRLRRCTNGTDRHESKTSARNSTSLSLHLERYPFRYQLGLKKVKVPTPTVDPKL